jgi:hypothetical protein
MLPEFLFTAFMGADPVGLFFLIAAFLSAVVGIFLIFRSPDAKVRRLAWRVMWATAAVFGATLTYAAFGQGIALKSAADVLKIAQSLVSVGGLTLFLWLLHYWCLPILLLWRYKDGQRHSWHVWAASSFIAAHFVWEELVHGREYAFIILLGFAWFPPLAALLGVIAAELLFRLKNFFGE